MKLAEALQISGLACTAFACVYGFIYPPPHDPGSIAISLAMLLWIASTIAENNRLAKRLNAIRKTLGAPQ